MIIHESERPVYWRGPSSFKAEILVEIPIGCGNPFAYFQRVIDTLKPWAVLHVVATRIEGSLRSVEPLYGTCEDQPTLMEIAGQEAFDELANKALSPLRTAGAKEFTPDHIYAAVESIVSPMSASLTSMAEQLERLTAKSTDSDDSDTDSDDNDYE